MSEWYWRQDLKHWRIKREPTQPGAALGTNVARLAQGGPFSSEKDAQVNASELGYRRGEVNIWEDLYSGK